MRSVSKKEAYSSPDKLPTATELTLIVLSKGRWQSAPIKPEATRIAQSPERPDDPSAIFRACQGQRAPKVRHLAKWPREDTGSYRPRHVPAGERSGPSERSDGPAVPSQTFRR